jgi:hypothetical protein
MMAFSPYSNGSGEANEKGVDIWVWHGVHAREGCARLASPRFVLLGCRCRLERRRLGHISHLLQRFVVNLEVEQSVMRWKRVVLQRAA